MRKIAEHWRACPRAGLRVFMVRPDFCIWTQMVGCHCLKGQIGVIYSDGEVRDIDEARAVKNAPTSTIESCSEAWALLNWKG